MQQFDNITSSGFVAWQKCNFDRTFYVVFGVLPRRIKPYLCIVDDFGNLVSI